MYQVIATSQGVTVATFPAISAANALAACAEAERKMGVKAQKMQMGDGRGSNEIVSWSGLEFTARRVN